MVKHFLLLLAALALVNCNTAQAQTDFRPGYIVTLAGDTVRGQADYRGALRSTRVCRFRTTPEATPTTYRPAELRAYGFTGQKEYRAALTPLPDSLGQPQPPQRFFLELLASGPATLYERRDSNDGTHYYLQKAPIGDAPVKELIYQKKLVEIDGRQFYREINTFRAALSEGFADCPSISLDVLKTSFSSSSLTNIVNRYNQCRQPGIAAPLGTRKAHLSLGVLAGAQVSQLYFRGPVPHADVKFVGDPAPMVGLTLQLVAPKISEKLSFRLEALYAQQMYAGGFTSYAAISYPTDEQVRYKVAYLRVPLLLRYTFPKGWLRPLVELGLTGSRALNIEAERRYRVISTSYSMPYSEWEHEFDDLGLKRLEIGIMAGLGAQVALLPNRPLTLLGRVERSDGFLNSAFDNYVWRYQLLLGMNLTK